MRMSHIGHIDVVDDRNTATPSVFSTRLTFAGWDRNVACSL